MAKQYLYKLNSFVNTEALRKYRDEHNLSNQELADKIDPQIKVVTLAGWISTGRVPKPVLKKLGIRPSGGASTRSAHAHTNVSGGEIYISYVDRDKEPAFKAFCEAMNINLKPVL